MSIALLWNRGLRPLSIIACLILGHKRKSSSSVPTGNSDWTESWGDFWSVWHLALPFDEYFITKLWYPHFQRFRRSSDNCGKIHVRIILGHPIVLLRLMWITGICTHRFWALLDSSLRCYVVSFDWVINSSHQGNTDVHQNIHKPMLSEIEDYCATRLWPSNRNDAHIHEYLLLLCFVLGPSVLPAISFNKL